MHVKGEVELFKLHLAASFSPSLMSGRGEGCGLKGKDGDCSNITSNPAWSLRLPLPEKKKFAEQIDHEYYSNNNL